jgi:hypothetical protein
MADTLVATAGASNADSYATLAEIEAHFTKFGSPASGWTGQTDDVKCRLARVAARWMDARWRWVGGVADLATPQALAWPRCDAYDADGRSYASTVVPGAIKALQAWVTRFLAEGKLAVDAATGQLIVAEQVDVISTTYDPYRRVADSFLDFLDGLARPLVAATGLRAFSNGG